MAASWLVEVYAPDGALRTILSPESPVEELWWALRGDGDCGEAMIRGLGLGLRPREIVAIRASDVVEALPPYVYWGWVVASPTVRDRHVAETRLIGGAQRLRELINRWPLLNAMDVARVAMFAAVGGSGVGDPPPGESGGTPLPRLAVGDGDFPNLGFTAGDRRPRSEMAVDTLEALRAMCPEFTIEPDSSYDYDGVSFSEGDVVPAVSWGVRAAADAPFARVFFRRPLGELTLDEVDDALTIEWQPVVAETVVDRVRVLLFDEPNEGTTESHSNGAVPSSWVPVAVDVGFASAVPSDSNDAFVSTSYAAAKVVPVNALDHMSRVGWVGTTTSTGVSNANNAFDTTESSYATNTGSVFVLARDVSSATRALRIRYSSFVGFRVEVQHFRDPIPGFPERYQVVSGVMPATEGVQKDMWILAPRSFSVGAGTRVRVTVTAATKPGEEPALEPGGLRVYTLEPLAADIVACTQVGRTHMVFPAEFAALVTVPNRLVPPKPRVEVTLADSSSVVGSGDAFEYVIDRQRGVTTFVRLNQALPASAESERSALTARFESAERRTLAAARRRL